MLSSPFDEPRVKMNDCAVAQIEARDRELPVRARERRRVEERH
jgi:hypothetical protein